MSRKRAWIRRGAAAIAAAAALTMAFQPAALAKPRWWDRPVGNYPTQQYSQHWDNPTRSADTTRSVRSTDPTPAADAAPAAQTDTATEIFNLTNREREKAGLPPLRRNDCLTRSAQSWSERMSSEQRMYHSNLGTWMRSCSLRSVGENVAYGARTPEQTVKMWMESPEHRKNILSANFTQLGVGSTGAQNWSTQAFGTG